MKKIKRALLGDNRATIQLRFAWESLTTIKVLTAIFALGIVIPVIAYIPEMTLWVLISLLPTVPLALLLVVLFAEPSYTCFEGMKLTEIQRKLDLIRSECGRKEYPFVRGFFLCAVAHGKVQGHDAMERCQDNLKRCRDKKVAAARQQHGELVTNEVEAHIDKLLDELIENIGAPSEEVAPYLRDYHACCADQYRNLTASECRAAIVKSARDADGEKVAQKVAQVIDRQHDDMNGKGDAA